MLCNLDNQRAAMREFLSLYELTQQTSTNSVSDEGSWKLLPVVNGDKALAALFGSGSKVGGLISQVHIGGLKTYTDSKQKVRGQALHFTSRNVKCKA